MENIAIELLLNSENRIIIRSEEYFGLKIRNLFPDNLSKIVDEPCKIDIEIIRDDKNVNFILKRNYENVIQSLFENWEYNLLILFENYCEKKYEDIILHGGGIIYNNHAFVFCQERKSGKSTLLCDMVGNPECSFLSDDILFIHNNKVCGLSNPIRLRNVGLNGIKSNGRICSETKGDEKVFLYVPFNNYSISFITLGQLFFISYDINNDNTCLKLSSHDAFYYLIKNVRKKKSMGDLFVWATNAISNYDMYLLKYNNIDYARKVIWSNMQNLNLINKKVKAN